MREPRFWARGGKDSGGRRAAAARKHAAASAGPRLSTLDDKAASATLDIEAQEADVGMPLTAVPGSRTGRGVGKAWHVGMVWHAVEVWRDAAVWGAVED